MSQQRHYNCCIATAMKTLSKAIIEIPPYVTCLYYFPHIPLQLKKYFVYINLN